MTIQRVSRVTSTATSLSTHKTRSLWGDCFDAPQETWSQLCQRLSSEWWRTPPGGCVILSKKRVMKTTCACIPIYSSGYQHSFFTVYIRSNSCFLYPDVNSVESQNMTFELVFSSSQSSVEGQNMAYLPTNTTKFCHGGLTCLRWTCEPASGC